MGDVKAWPKPTGIPAEVPKPVKRPCDYGLDRTWVDLETQLGTIEAYNRIVALAQRQRARIEAGEITAQNPIYARHPRGET